MKFKNKRILTIWLFITLYLFSGIVLPLNSTFNYTHYDDDTENECCEVCQNNQVNHLKVDKNNENEVEEIDDDSFLYSVLKAEKLFCIIQNSNLNLENILSGYSQLFKIILFDGRSKQDNIVNLCINNENTLTILRTVILLN